MEYRALSSVLEAPPRRSSAASEAVQVAERTAPGGRRPSLVRALCTAFESDGGGRGVLRLLDRLGERFWVARTPGDVLLHVSRACAELWGRSAAELVRDPSLLEEGIHPEDRARLGCGVPRLAGRILHREVLRLLRPDGTVRSIRVRSLALPSARRASGARLVVGVVEDLAERERLQERARRGEAELCALAAELVLAEERERRRLAQDLHDGLDQTLELARLRLGLLLKDPAGVPARAALEELARLLGQGLLAARTLTFELSPPVLHDLGLGPALEWLAESLQAQRGLRVSLDLESPREPLGEEARVLLFRSARELLINVAKHSGVARARLAMRAPAGELVLCVEDSGVGFDPGRALRPGKGGSGLFGIGQRLRSLGGFLEIHSLRDIGSAVLLRLPLAPCAAR